MSRIVKIRIKSSAGALRRARSPTPSVDLSDDDGYSAVEEISDDEDADEEDVFAAEEEHIINYELHGSSSAPRPQPGDDADAEDADDEDGGEEEEEDAEDDGEGVQDHDENDGDSDGSVWEGIPDDDEIPQTHSLLSAAPIKRQVRFADVPSSDSDSTDTEVDIDDHTDFFPDIFVDKSALDPRFRREIEYDPDGFYSRSLWDYDFDLGGSEDDLDPSSLTDDDTPIASPVVSRPPLGASLPGQDDGEPEELDGYESEGDTTEEDIPEPIVRRPSTAASEEAVESDDGIRIKAQRGRPRLGSFRLDRTDKPTAVFDASAGKMIIFTPRKRRPVEAPLAPMSTPILGSHGTYFTSSGDVMISAVHPSHGFAESDFLMGPAEAFFPCNEDAFGIDVWSESSVLEEEEEEDDAEKQLNLADFITWDDDSEGDEEGEEDDNYVTSTTPMRPSTACSESDPLGHLTTLNSEIVGAFRRNQINQQLISSEKATHDSLAFSGPYNATALRGIKSDRFDTACTPLTPIRRRRKYSDSTKSPSEALAQKRKASSTLDGAYGHKRQRSISDTTMLRT